MSNEYVIVPKSEINIAEWAIVFTEIDLENIIERRDSFIKFLNKSIHKYQADHWQFLDVGREAETYIAVNTIKGLIASLENTFTMYKELKEKWDH
jgi:hypothetical protein